MIRQCSIVALGLALGFTPPQRNPEQVKQELRAFALDQNRARLARDRSALERLYADEFLIIHALGYVDDKATVIAETIEEASPPQLPIPTFEPPQSLHISGDFAIVRNPQVRTGARLDGTAAWSTSIFVHRDGRWQLFQRQATELVVLPPVIALAPERLPIYAGTYRTSAGDTVRIEVRDNGLYSVSDRLPPRRLLPIGDDLFTTKLGGELRFNRSAAGRIMGYASTFRSREITATRAD